MHVEAEYNTTLESEINVPGRLLILEKNSTQDKFIPTTPFIQN